ncbi:MAG: DUF4199 domain-containing protein [Alistipes sp.]|nr:DUF4199 domain-containing protein [Alistipes sp.]
MERKTFWNEAAKWGVIVGLLLSVSFVVENLITVSGKMWLYYLMMLEWIGVVVLHFWLLLRFAQNRSRLYGAAVGFTFGQGYGAVMTVSAFAGVIVGVVQAVYLHLIVGYSNHIERIIAAVTELVSKSGSQMPASMEGLLSQSFQQLRTAPVPSVLQTVWGGLFSALFFGAVFGLIIAAITTRAPRPFDETNEESDDMNDNAVE